MPMRIRIILPIRAPIMAMPCRFPCGAALMDLRDGRSVEVTEYANVTKRIEGNEIIYTYTWPRTFVFSGSVTPSHPSMLTVKVAVIVPTLAALTSIRFISENIPTTNIALYSK